MSHHGRPKRMILESEILVAQSISKSGAEAARKLGVSFLTYRKYAKMYNLYDRIANMRGEGISKPRKDENNGKFPLDQILEGKFPNYCTHRLKFRMLRGNRVEQKCNKCGFCERRLTDNQTPLMLNYIDGDPTNKLRENIELLCYNCYYLCVNNPFGNRGNRGSRGQRENLGDHGARKNFVLLEPDPPGPILGRSHNRPPPS